MKQRLEKIIRACTEQGVSDLHLTGEHPAIFRKNGVCYPQKNIVYTVEECDALAEAILEVRHLKTLRARWSVDFGLFLAGSSMRCNVVATQRGLSYTFRFLPGSPPTIDNLNLHPTLHEILKKRSGLILFCGATGSGKTSTIAAMLNEINRSREAHILTLEDPIEYRFRSVRSFVEQRELGVHFQDFERGLYDALRQMPDVILIGELREKEIMRQTLNIAESGHLVFGTLHASTPEEAIYRFCNAFPMEAQELVRFQLASSLIAVIVQQLEMMPKLGYRLPILSILRNSTSVKNTLRENKLSQLDNIVAMGQAEGMFTFERYREEFLDRKERFVPPSVAFQQGRASEPEAVGRSRLVDYDILSPEVSLPQTGAAARSKPSRAPEPETLGFHMDEAAFEATDDVALQQRMRDVPRNYGAADATDKSAASLALSDGEPFTIDEEQSYEELIKMMERDHGGGPAASGTE